MAGVKIGWRVVKVGDRVKLVVGGATGIRPAEVIDVADGVTRKLHLRVGKRVIKNVPYGRKVGHWT